MEKQMKKETIEAAVDYALPSARDVVALLMGAIGVHLAVSQFVGSMLLGVVAALIASRLEPEQDRREFWVVVGTAALVSLSSILAVQGVAGKPPLFNPTLTAIGAGFVSRYIARIVLRVAGVALTRSGTLFDRALERVLPDVKRGGKE